MPVFRRSCSCESPFDQVGRTNVITLAGFDPATVMTPTRRSGEAMFQRDDTRAYARD